MDLSFALHDFGPVIVVSSREGGVDLSILTPAGYFTQHVSSREGGVDLSSLSAVVMSHRSGLLP